jgi:hypothetical protein
MSPTSWRVDISNTRMATFLNVAIRVLAKRVGDCEPVLNGRITRFLLGERCCAIQRVW